MTSFGVTQIIRENYMLTFKIQGTALKQMPSDDFAIVIRAGKTPASEHERRYNAPPINKVAILTVGEDCNSCDMIIHRRNGTIQRVSETHRSYDALQYPILFCQ
ncbi:hypothetical protein TKK_0018634 [Trichogramma kaykai]